MSRRVRVWTYVQQRTLTAAPPWKSAIIMPHQKWGDELCLGAIYVYYIWSTMFVHWNRNLPSSNLRCDAEHNRRGFRHHSFRSRLITIHNTTNANCAVEDLTRMLLLLLLLEHLIITTASVIPGPRLQHGIMRDVWSVEKPRPVLKQSVAVAAAAIAIGKDRENKAMEDVINAAPARLFLRMNNTC